MGRPSEEAREAGIGGAGRAARPRRRGRARAWRGRVQRDRADRARRGPRRDRRRDVHRADAAELVHAATVAVVGEVPLDRLWHAVPAYPTVSEVWLRLLEAAGCDAPRGRVGGWAAGVAWFAAESRDGRLPAAVSGERAVAGQHEPDRRLALAHGVPDQPEVVGLELGDVQPVGLLQARLAERALGALRRAGQDQAAARLGELAQRGHVVLVGERLGHREGVLVLRLRRPVPKVIPDCVARAVERARPWPRGRRSRPARRPAPLTLVLRNSASVAAYSGVNVISPVSRAGR